MLVSHLTNLRTALDSVLLSYLSTSILLLTSSGPAVLNTIDSLMTLRFISPSEIFLMNDRPFYPTTFSTSPLGCLTATSNLLCPKTNSFHCLQWQLYSSGCLSQRGPNLGIILDSSLSQTLSNPSANSINSSSKYT